VFALLVPGGQKSALERMRDIGGDGVAGEGLRHQLRDEVAVADAEEAAISGFAEESKRSSASNSRLLIGWQTHAVNGQPAPALLFGGVHASVLRQAGPLPLLGPFHQTSFHRIQVDILKGLQVVFHRAERVVESLP